MLAGKKQKREGGMQRRQEGRKGRRKLNNGMNE